MKLCTKSGEECLKAGIRLPVEPYVELGKANLQKIRYLLRELERQNKLIDTLRETIFGKDGCASSVYFPTQLGNKLNRNRWIIGAVFIMTAFIAPLQSLQVPHMVTWALGWNEFPNLLDLSTIIPAVFSFLASRDALRLYALVQKTAFHLKYRNELIQEITSITQHKPDKFSFHGCPMVYPGTPLSFVYNELHNPGWDEAMSFVSGSIDLVVARALRRLEAKD